MTTTGGEAHPVKRLDDAVHQRTRLGILTVLSETGRADFTFLRETLQLTDGNLSRSLTRLEEAGYITIDKVLAGNRPRTWLRITSAGRKALDAEISALRDIINRVEQSSPRRAESLRPRTV